MQYVVILFILAICSCNTTPKYELKEGDLLFKETLNNALSDAISDVTDTTGQYRFSHVGVVVKKGDRWMVLEAVHDNGVRLCPLDAFGMAAKGEIVHVVAGRLKEEYRYDLERFKTFGLSQLNKPYDYRFDWNDSAFYCSELVYRMFVEAGQTNAFKPNVMTFKNREGEFDFTWIKYFERIQSPIPEGELGINPNAMAQSSAVELFREINY